MKKLLIFVVIMAAFIVAAPAVYSFAKPTLDKTLFYSPCETPVAYRLGSIDSKYNLSQSDVIDDMKQAADIWNKAYGKPILVYDPSSAMPINFIYDQRQSLLDQSKTIDNEVNQLQSSLSQQASTLSAQKNSLDPQYQKIQQDSDALSQKLNSFNQEISYWKSQGHIPPDAYQSMKDEQAEIAKEGDALNAEIAQYQTLVQNYKSQLSNFQDKSKQLDVEGDQFNQISQNMTDVFGSNSEEGVFIQDQNNALINIYFIVNQKELVHTLAHEMGHSLGFGHVQDPKAIMYPDTTQTLTPSNDDLSQLQSICATKSVIIVFAQRVENGLENIYTSMQPTRQAAN